MPGHTLAGWWEDSFPGESSELLKLLYSEFRGEYSQLKTKAEVLPSPNPGSSPTLSWPLHLIVTSYLESTDQAATIRPQVSSRTGSEPAKLTARNRRLWEHQRRSKHLAQMASHSQDTVSTEASAAAPVPAEKPYRKTELQVKMGTEAPVLIF